MFPARENPFATRHVLKIRYRFPNDSWEGFLGRLAQANHRGALVGPEGSGKTTLLEDLESRLRNDHWNVVRRQLHRGDRQPPAELVACAATLSKRDFFLLDGAEQLSWFAWMRLKRLTLNAGGFVITLHRPGRLPTLYNCRGLPEMFRSCLAELGVEERVNRDLQAKIFKKNRGNIRDCLRDLYDRYARGGWTSLESGQ